MREASKRRTVTDTDSYAFIISLTANERMTEANLMGMFKKIIKTTLLLLIILLFPVNSFGEKIKDSGTTNGYKWETISIRKGLCFVGGAQLKVNGKIVVSKKDDISFIVHAERLDNFDGAPYFAISKDTGLFGGTVLSKKSLINCKGEKLPLPEFYTIDPYIDLKGRDGVIFDSRAYIPDEKYYYLNGELIKTKLNK